MYYYNINQSEILASFWMDLHEQHARPKRRHVSLANVLQLVKGAVGERQDAKKIIFTACHLGKLKLSPDVISANPKNLFD